MDKDEIREILRAKIKRFYNLSRNNKVTDWKINQLAKALHQKFTEELDIAKERERWYDNLVLDKVRNKHSSLKEYVDSIEPAHKQALIDSEEKGYKRGLKEMVDGISSSYVAD